MKLIIHRGTHEIGGSCVEIRDNDTGILIDIGLPLPHIGNNDFGARELEKCTGQELLKRKILPDIPGIYTWDIRTPAIHALLLSHAHLDHYGFIQYIKESVAVYCGEPSKKLINATVPFTPFSQYMLKNTISIKSNKRFSIGSLRITPYLMDHSAFDAYGFLVASGSKRIFYSGDFRDHGRKAKAFQWFLKNGPKKVDALLLEGTMLSRPDENTISETDIEQKIVDLAEKTDNIVFIYSSSQNIDRLVSVYRAAIRTHRLLVIDVYTALILDTLHSFATLPYPSKKFPGIRVFYPYWLCERLAKQGKREMMYRFKDYKITKEEISANLNEIIMLVRPSMVTDLNRIDGLDGASLVYSLWEGYLEEPYVKNFMNYMNKRGVSWHSIHTSGHATVEALKKMVNRLQPKMVIPIHTVVPKEYGKYFNKVRVAEDGEVVEI